MMVRNISWESDHHIRMISEGSCDTEDWSNDAEKSALTLQNKLHFTIFMNRNQLFQIVIIFHNIAVFFHQINAALVSIRDFFQNHKKILPAQNFWTVVYFDECFNCFCPWNEGHWGPVLFWSSLTCIRSSFLFYRRKRVIVFGELSL